MQHFTAPDGACIAYRDTGFGRPLVLLHGLMAHSGFFRNQAPLAADFRLISVDLRGHGESRSNGAAPTVEALAGDVGALADYLGLEGAVGLGWSLGAAVMWLALTGPQGRRFAGSVIVDMSPRVLNGGDWQLGLSREACDARSDAIAGDFESFAVNAGQAIFAQPVAAERQDDAAWASREFARNDAATMGRLWSSLMGEDFRPLLGRIRQPALIVHGVQSQLYGAATAEQLAAALPNARAIAFQHSGHAPHIEEPALFNQVIKDFAAGLPQVRTVQTARN